MTFKIAGWVVRSKRVSIVAAVLAVIMATPVAARADDSRGVLPAEGLTAMQPRTRAEHVGAGGRAQTRPNVALLSAGIATFALLYLPAVASPTFLPFAGPEMWVPVVPPIVWGFAGLSASTRGPNALISAALVADGILQGVGVGLFVAGLATPIRTREVIPHGADDHWRRIWWNVRAGAAGTLVGATITITHF
jgi:hypothetical protein